jgi:hypothetical protein
MDPQNRPGLQVGSWLKTLGVECRCQWDVLVFLYRHTTSLVSGEHIARLLGWPTAEVVTALDALEPLGLVKRSRVDQGVRLYQFTAPVDSPRGDALTRLLNLAASRSGRLLLAQELGRGGRADPISRHPCLRQGGGPTTWLKAI